MEAVTAFGALFASPQQTAAVLRARAAAAGLEPGEAPPAELVAAVIGAQAWMAVLRVPALSAYAGPGAAGALAAVYCRASGAASAAVPASERDCLERMGELSNRLAHHPPGNLAPAALSALSAVADWALEHGCGPAELVAAAEDLASGWELPQLAAASDALICLATLQL